MIFNRILYLSCFLCSLISRAEAEDERKDRFQRESPVVTEGAQQPRSCLYAGLVLWGLAKRNSLAHFETIVSFLGGVLKLTDKYETFEEMPQNMFKVQFSS